MSSKDLPDTLDDEEVPVPSSAAPHSTAVPETEASRNATPGLDLRGYQLMDRLGGGGMGDVYRAVDPALGRDLAVKVMRAGLQGHAAAEQRFVREARVTGSLQHPSIVPVHNLGRLNDGRLHYTMRLVRGQTFAAILKEEAGRPERLPWLLTIFEKVCQATAYAHSKRVIHRDLKPANVMVGRFGEVQVMDWGLAKVLEAGERGCVSAPSEPEEGGARIGLDSEEAPQELTWIGHEMGTPSYMPPEQALGAWDTVDERADVFALGAILCEILTGQPPYRSRDSGEVLLKAKGGELGEALARLDSCGAEAALLSLCRECLAPMRESRPRDAEQVAQRVAAYQAQVQERLRYAELERAEAVVQAREERKRRRWMWAALLLLVAGAAGSSWQALRATSAEGQARENEGRALENESRALAAVEAERQANDLAKTRLAQIEKVNEMLTSIFRDLDPRAEEKGGPGLRQQLSQHLERAAGKMGEGAIGDAATLARLQVALGKSLLNLGQIERASVLLGEAARTLESQFGADHSDTLDSRDHLAAAFHAVGRTADAIRLHEQTLKLREAKLGPDHPDTLTSRNNLAVVYGAAAGRTADAIRLLEQTLKQREAKFGPDHPSALTTRDNLAEAYHAAGRIADAIRLLEQTLKQREAKLGPDHHDTLTSRNNLAGAYRSAGRTADAIRLHEQSLKQCEAKLGPDHPLTLTSRNNLAAAYWSAGRTADAIRLLEQTLKQREAKLGADHNDTLTSRNNLAEAYFTAGRIADAIGLHEQNFKQCEAKLGPDHPLTLAFRHNLAAVSWDAGRTAEAIHLFEQNLKLREAKLGPDHPDTLQSMANLGTAYRDTGRLKEAIALLETALQRGRQRTDGLSASLARLPSALAEAYERAGQFTKAEVIYRDARERAQRQFGADDPRTAGALAQLGANLLKQQKISDAESLLRQGLKIREQKQPEAWTTFNTRSVLGEALLGQKKYTEAEPLLVLGYQGMKQRQDKIPPAYRLARLSEALERLVRLYEATEQKEKAAEWRKKLQETKTVQKKPNP